MCGVAAYVDSLRQKDGTYEKEDALKRLKEEHPATMFPVFHFGHEGGNTSGIPMVAFPVNTILLAIDTDMIRFMSGKTDDLPWRKQLEQPKQVRSLLVKSMQGTIETT
jgi:hypothetical protein